MRTIWQALAWKEWHEHKWKLVSTAAILIGLIGVSLLFNFGPDSIALANMLILLGAMPLALFIAAGTGTGERARQTLEFTQSLPASMWKVAVQKLFFGWLTCIVPLLLAILVLAAAHQLASLFGGARELRLFNLGRPINEQNGLLAWLAMASLAPTVGLTSLYLWTAAIGVNRKDEVSAGAWALVVIAIWWTVAGYAIALLSEQRVGAGPVPAVASIVSAISPGGSSTLALQAAAGDPVRISSVVAALIIHIALAGWFIYRFGKTSQPAAVSHRLAVGTGGRAMYLAPKRSPFAAIFWKQYRESAPTVLAGLLGIATISMVVLSMNWAGADRRFSAQVVAVTTCYLGAAITMVVAIGAFLNDMTPEMQSFWRSRPVNPDLWFWTKLATSLVVLAAGLVIPFATAFGLETNVRSEASVPGFWFLLAPLWIFSTLVLMTCLVRQAIYAAVLGVGAMYLGCAGVAAVIRWCRDRETVYPWDAFWRIESSDVAAAICILTVAYLSLAWLAVRYDWGWNQRA